MGKIEANKISAFDEQFLKKYLEWRNDFLMEIFVKKFIKKGKKKLSKLEIPILNEQNLTKYLQWRNDSVANPAILKGVEWANPTLLKSTQFDSDEVQILYHIEEGKFGKFDKLDMTDEIDESDESEDFSDDFDYGNFNFDGYDSDDRYSGFFILTPLGYVHYDSMF